MPPSIGRAFANRGMSRTQAEELVPQSLIDATNAIGSPSGTNQAAAELLAAGRSGRVGILCDYDVDGATAQGILVEALRAAQPSRLREPVVAVPDRHAEGFGPNERCLTDLARSGATCVAVLDCGTASGPLLNRFQSETGIRVVVVDHHPAHGLKPPDAAVLVNPWVSDGPDPGKQGTLCAAGLSWFVARSILRQAGLTRAEAGPALLRVTLLAALGTSCDMMRLDTPFNRSLIRFGVKLLGKPEVMPPGLQGIRETTGRKRPPTAGELSWRIGPRLNAGSRMGESDLAAHCLRERDAASAREMAERLDAHNTKRKSLCEAAEKELDSAGDAASLARGPVNVRIVQSASPGIVGLVASTLVKRHGWPAVVLTEREGSKLAGSGRSSLRFDLGSAVSAAHSEGILLSGGGHRKACGVEVDESKVDQFTDFLRRRFQRHASRSANPCKPAHAIDAALRSEELSSSALMSIAEALQRLSPWGEGLKSPLFGVRRCRLAGKPWVKGSHLFLTLRKEKALFDAVWWSAPADWTGRLASGPGGAAVPRIDIAGRVELNEWQGRRSGRIVIRSARTSPD